MLLCSNYSNAQEVLTTGNLVNFTGTPTTTTGNWVNGYYVHGLTCWKSGDPGNCGPYPNVQTNGSINFSYGQVNLNQVVNINNALSDAGVGVQVSGFNFGFRAKNGNGWDNGQQDYLDAYVKFYNSQAKVVESYDYAQYTNRKYNWSDFNFTETFTKPYDVNRLAAAQFGFIGRDTNGWAGPYGPEIYNVSFSLNYRIDPCVANPASSPSCPGFNNLIKPATTMSIAPTLTIAADSTSTANSTVNVGGAQLSNAGAISALDNIPQVIKDTQTQQAKTQESNKSAPDMSKIMSIIGQIQANDRATQTAAVQNANRAIAASAAAAQEQANAVVEASNAASIMSSQNQITTVSSQGGYATTVASAESSLTTSKSISMNDLLQSRMNIDSSNNNTSADTVNKNVQPNELAGKMDIASIAIQPKGFDVYATLIIKDADFYAPKDIYGNQKTIDNARALRLLSSDRLHQEMIDQQYKAK